MKARNRTGKNIDRRDFLKTSSLAGIGASASAMGLTLPEQNSNPSGLKVTGIETVPSSGGRFMYLKLYTNQDIVGYGEPMNYEHWRPIQQAVNDIADWLIGKDPLRIEHHWQVWYRSTYAQEMPVIMSAMSGIDMALWDILGKVTGQPVWRLLGGNVRDRVLVYAGFGGNSAEEAAESALRTVEDGFRGIKTSIGGPAWFVETPKWIDNAVRRIAAVREAVGDDVHFGVDFHRRLSVPMCKIMMRELEPFGLMWIEEPLKPGNDEALSMLSQMSTIPIATGERSLTRWGFMEMIERELCNIIQPDIRHSGGISEFKRLANHAEIHNMAIAPHNAGSGAIGVAASVHVCATIPNLMICEGGRNRGEGLFHNPLVLKNGFIELPTEPGLGVDMDDDAFEALRDERFRHRGMYFREDDGSYSDY